MHPVEAAIVEVAEATGFSGVVRVDIAGAEPVSRAFGFANRSWGVPNTVDTRFGVASGTKSFTAATILALVEHGRLELVTPVRSVLGDDLPLIDESVTLEHLLAHRSGIGDYFDESSIEDPVDFFLPVPVRELVDTVDYLPLLEGHPTVFPPGERFDYNNGGFVVLALVAERVTGTPFAELVETYVWRPAGMTDTGFFRSDALPARTALGYVDAGTRTNVFHLPCRGSGDGGAYTTAADVTAFWQAFAAGRIVSPLGVAEITRPRSTTDAGARYGLGFWLAPAGPAVEMEGSDVGVSFNSVWDPASGTIRTVLSNTAGGAWPMARRLTEVLA